METPCNHKVKHQKQVALKAQDNPLAEPSERNNSSSHPLFQRRRYRTQNKRLQQPNALNRFIEHTRSKLFEIHNDIWKLRHRNVWRLERGFHVTVQCCGPYANMAFGVPMNGMEGSLTLILLIALCFFAGPATTRAQENRDWTSLVEAERAFAAASLTKGTRAAFMDFLAEDSILFRPGPVAGKKWIEEHPAPPTLLTWEPAFAEVAQSGDLGYTTGPWEIRPSGPEDKPPAYGHFVSVWRRQPDGAWKVVVDLGISHAAPTGSSKAPQPSSLQRSEKIRRNIRIDEERSELLAFDGELANSVSEKGSAQAYLRYLADDARLYRARAFPVVGKREIFAILSQTGTKPTLHPEKAGISSAADLGYTYGTSRSMAPGSADSTGSVSHYLHIWKRKGNRWTLVLDVESPMPQRAAAR